MGKNSQGSEDLVCKKLDQVISLLQELIIITAVGLDMDKHAIRRIAGVGMARATRIPKPKRSTIEKHAL